MPLRAGRRCLHSGDGEAWPRSSIVVRSLFSAPTRVSLDSLAAQVRKADDRQTLTLMLDLARRWVLVDPVRTLTSARRPDDAGRDKP